MLPNKGIGQHKTSFDDSVSRGPIKSAPVSAGLMPSRDLGNLLCGTLFESTCSGVNRRLTMTVWMMAGLAFTVSALAVMFKRRTGRREFDERSDVTKIVLAADRRRKDANAALRFMREK